MMLRMGFPFLTLILAFAWRVVRPIVVRIHQEILADYASLSCMTRTFPPLRSSSSQSLLSSKIVTFPGVTSSSENLSPQLVAAISSIGVVSGGASYLT
ncbi:hypothetical protein Tco_0828667 [Tanacetum coccineum]